MIAKLFTCAASALLVISNLGVVNNAVAESIQPSKEIVDHVVWNNVPITLVLPVGIERRIDFPTAVDVEWPDDVRQNTQNLQIRENGSVYWTAGKVFVRQRVNVFSRDGTGRSWLLDVEARGESSARTLVVLDDRFDDGEDEKNALRLSGSRGGHQYDGVDLVRFAAQNLYAPSKRLVKPLPGVVRVPVETSDVPLFRGGDLRSSPIAQWKAPGVPALYATAVRITSDSLDPVILDPRNLRGNWISATPQHGAVSPAGEPGSTTVWYLLSSRPFEESIP